MRKKISIILCLVTLTCSILAGCAGKSNNTETNTTNETVTDSEREKVKSKEQESALKDGKYTVDFNTDSAMFHASEACNGKGTLSVDNGKMTLHVSLVSKSILNLFLGVADDAKKGAQELIQPSNDTVKYSDGTTEEVYGFDIPINALDEEFDLAIIGTKDVWYDHKVSVSNPVIAD